jgi:hypothetical protein
MKSEMRRPEWPYTPVAEIVALPVAVAVADKVADAEVAVETDARSTNAHTAQWTIIPPKHAEKEHTLKAIQIPPGKTSGHATTVVSQDTSKPTESTSKVPGINATRSTMAQVLPRSLQQEITSRSD